MASGSRYTPIVGVKINDGSDKRLPVYGDQNSKRYPIMHQLDVRIDYSTIYKWIVWQWYLEVLNLYNQSNITAYRFDPQSRALSDEDVIDDIPLREDSGLGIIPSMGIKIVF